MTEVDIPPFRVKYLLARRGLTFAAVDRMYQLTPGTCRKTARRPHLHGELALAEALALSPRQIWPSRYAASGERLSPQPVANYTIRARREASQKRKAA